MKTIGVLGGLGPQATMRLEAQIHRAAQRLLPPSFNGGYPPMVVWYCRHPPVVVADDGAPRHPVRADPRLLESAARLGALADFLVIPSNGAHLVRQEVERAAGREVLSMVELALAEVRRRGWSRVGVLGLGEPAIYLRPLREMGLACESLDAAARAPLDAAIFRVMEGRDDDGSAEVARGAVAAMRARGVDGVILGCTEIPLLLGGDDVAGEPDLLDPSPLLAEAAVRRAAGA